MKREYVKICQNMVMVHLKELSGIHPRHEVSYSEPSYSSCCESPNSSPRKPGFSFRVVYLGFVVDEMPVVIPPMLHRSIHLLSEDGTIGPFQAAVPRDSVSPYSCGLQPRTSG
jgi:hypothetical protein